MKLRHFGDIMFVAIGVGVVIGRFMRGGHVRESHARESCEEDTYTEKSSSQLCQIHQYHIDIEVIDPHQIGRPREMVSSEILLSSLFSIFA